VKDLRDEPLKCGAQVELEGIVIQPERIELKMGDLDIVLRQTTIEDLEKEFPVYGFIGPRFMPHPSAILSIQFLGRYANEIQTNVERAITVLRLFKVGSVRFISYRMFSESITDIMASGTITAGQSEQALEKYLVTEADTDRLKKFWQTMMRVLPRNLYELGEAKSDHLSIAYKRYCDALMQNGLLERRIANCVMGLESLFLKGGEAQELAYRLSVRTGKLFGLLGHQPHKVRETIKDAYETRSLFVHGGHLSYKDRKGLERVYGDLRSFLTVLLDSLRLSILVTMFEKRDKDEFIDLIDESLIDPEGPEEGDPRLLQPPA